jgi:hypothetical protein
MSTKAARMQIKHSKSQIYTVKQDAAVIMNSRVYACDFSQVSQVMAYQMAQRL